MKYAIHRAVPYTAEELCRGIQNNTDFQDASVSVYADGWVIADPAGIEIVPWSRHISEYDVFEIKEEA